MPPDLLGIAAGRLRKVARIGAIGMERRTVTEMLAAARPRAISGGEFMVVKGSEPAGPYGDHELFLQRQDLGVRILRDRDRFFVDVGNAASQLWFNLPIVLEFVGLAASKTFVAGYSIDEQEANLKAQLELLAANSTLFDDLFRHDLGFDHRMSELDAFRREKARKRFSPKE